ncbi:methionyl-tRNA formyltransferase [Phycisphaerales bacterium AB-hyl4]|uniref:Methionyl-tRNA formyltransferase n=1 Tax=Natronomicrosphaera hydrolytica TaxID=3242702 RepID=A0ABV4U1N4_9BACT
MRIIFVGSGEFGLPTLERLHQQHDVVAVVSQPDRPAGRKRQLTPTPIAAWAQQQSLPLLKADDVNTNAFIEQLAPYQPDAAVVVAFGQKLSPGLIDALGKLVVNLHGSLLPKYRGAAPVNWALINGDTRTGVTVIGLAQRMDAGAMYAQAELQITPHETAGELHDRLAQLGPDIIEQVLDRFEQGILEPQHQDDTQATRAPKLSKADGTADFTQPAEQVRNRIHGLTPWPGCRVNWHCQHTGQTQPLTLRRADAMPNLPDFVKTDTPPGTVLDGMLVMTGQGVIKLLELQAAGTRPMNAHAFANGHHLAPGDHLEMLDR